MSRLVEELEERACALWTNVSDGNRRVPSRKSASFFPCHQGRTLVDESLKVNLAALETYLLGRTRVVLDSVSLLFGGCALLPSFVFQPLRTGSGIVLWLLSLVGWGRHPGNLFRVLLFAD
jgi:hypothetical protein